VLIKDYDDTLKKVKHLWEIGDKRPVDINGVTAPYLPDIIYVPFDGHQSWLGHYYRHLFQTVKYIDQQPDDIIKNKYDYVKNLRAQLSTYEQLLLYYNALSRMGRPWITEDYMRRYCIVKNMPLPLANFGPDPVATLGEQNEQGISMFEWNEVVL
jgi:AAA+ ATPase superfamily predicted ATPase